MILVDYPGHLLTAGLVVLCLIPLWSSFRAKHVHRLGWKRWALGLLTLLPLLVMLMIFFNPSRIQTTEQSRPCTVQVYFDTSQSMSIRDVDNKTRLIYAVEVFKDNFVSNDTDSANFQFFGFDQMCYPADSLQRLQPKGRQTNLSSLWQRLYLQSIQTEAVNTVSPVTGAIVFTDGQADNQTLASYATIQNEDFPILLVPIGSEQKQPDLVATSLTAPSRVAVNTVYTVSIAIEAKQLKDQRVYVDLLQNDHVVDTRVWIPGSSISKKTLDFELSASSSGLDKIEAMVRSLDNELNTANNRRIKLVNVIGSQKRKVLFYSQVAGFDVGKVRQALRRDKKIDLDFRLDAIVHLSVNHDASEVTFPAEQEKLNEYDVLVLGPMNFNTFSDAQMQNLYSFVADRGGAIIFMPGKGQMALSNMHPTRLSSLLPVVFCSQPENVDYTVRPIPLSFTPEGQAEQPFSTLEMSSAEWALAPGYLNVQKKPAASTFMSADRVPFLCTHRVGRGRVSFLNSFMLYRLYRSDLDGGPLQELLSGLIAHDSRIGTDESRIDLVANVDTEQQRVVFEACVRDSRYQAVGGATVLLDVNGQSFKMSPASPGRYTVTVDNLSSRSVYAVAKAELGGNYLGRKTMILDLPKKQDEMSRTEVNKQFLNSLADRSHVKVLEPDQMNSDIHKMFKATETLQANAVPVSIWHNWPLVLLLCGLLTLNWFVRRSSGLV